MLGQVKEGSCVGDEPGAHQLAYQDCEVWRDGHHAVLEVLVELRAVLGNVDNLLTQVLDVGDVHVRDLGAHGDLCRLLDLLLDVLRQDVGEVGVGRVGA